MASEPELIEEPEPLHRRLGPEDTTAFVDLLRQRGLLGHHVPTTERGCYISRSKIGQMFQEGMSQGRWTWSAAASSIGVTETDLRASVNAEGLFSSRDDVWKRTHLDETLHKILQDVVRQEGKLSLHDLCQSKLHLPQHEALELLIHNLPVGLSLLVADSGAKILVSDGFLSGHRACVTEALESLTEPVSLKELCLEKKWDAGWTIDLAKDMPGELHGDTFVPVQYHEQQRLSTLDSFATKGYLSKPTAPNKAAILEANPEAIALKDSVIHPERLILPLETAILEVVETESFASLPALIPSELWSDAKALMNDHVLPRVGPPHGVVVLSQRTGVYLSPALLDSLESGCVVPTKEYVAKSAVDDPTEEQIETMLLEQLRTAILEVGGELSSLLSTEDELLTALCQSVLLSQDVISDCLQMSIREAKCRRATQASVFTVSNHDLPAIEAAFEEVFPTACYLLQVLEKGCLYLAKASGDASFIEDFRHGPLSHFISRITRLCLLKNDIDSDAFYFAVGPDEVELPHFCSPVDLSRLRYPYLELRCTPNEKGDERDPTNLLAEMLPPTVGRSLVRLWSLDADCMTDLQEHCMTVCGLPFKRLDKKAEKSLLASRKAQLLDRFDICEEEEVLDLAMLLLFQQVRNLAVLSGDSVLPILLRERKLSTEDADELQRLVHEDLEGLRDYVRKREGKKSKV